jgi:hypothetical protein
MKNEFVNQIQNIIFRFNSIIFLCYTIVYSIMDFEKNSLKINKLEQKIKCLMMKQEQILEYKVKCFHQIKLCKQINCRNVVETQKTRCEACLKRNRNDMLKYRQKHPDVYEKMRLYASKRYQKRSEE